MNALRYGTPAKRAVTDATTRHGFAFKLQQLPSVVSVARELSQNCSLKPIKYLTNLKVCEKCLPLLKSIRCIL